MKIGILGGTFDPVHAGHIALARAAKEQFGLDKVLFVPAFIPPHKTAHRDLTPAPYRYRMIELAIRCEPDFELSDVELNRPEVSYTVDTIRAIKKRYRAAELYLIVGADTLQEIPRWHESKAICDMAQILAAPRPGAPRHSPFKDRVHWIEMPEQEVSASEIRETFRKGKALQGEKLPEGVENYISRLKLYQKDSLCP